MEKKGILESFAELIANSDMVDLTNMYRVLFRMFLALFMIIGGGIFLWDAATIEEEKITQLTTMIVGFVIGTFLAVPIGFYFGGQDRQKKNEEEPK